MNRKKYRNGLICAMIGSVLTMIGDFLIGANPAADVPTGVAMIDLYGDCLRNSDLRMMAGGMLGVIGMPLTGIGYYRIYEAFIRKEGGILAFLYKLAALVCIAIGGVGVHLPCAVISLLYKWIVPTDPSLAMQIAERYTNYILIPFMIVFGILLFIALMYQIYVFAKGKTSYPRWACIFNMAFGVIVPYLMAFLTGHNVIGNGIGTAAISIGHLWMFGGLLASVRLVKIDGAGHGFYGSAEQEAADLSVQFIKEMAEESGDTGNEESETSSEKSTADSETEELSLTVGDTPVQVEWEDNESVKALKELVKNKPLTIQMSMYGGFEQVGAIGTDLPRNDEETTTEAGDIVLYSGNQISVFYGSNSWAYTRLGKITDKTERGLADLLNNGNVTVTIAAR